MRSPEVNQDIDIRVLTHMTHLACWNFEDGRHSITINLGASWLRGVNMVDRYRGYSILEEAGPGDFPEKWPAYETYIEAFIDQFNESFLTELVCIERRRQGLRMKFPRCKPCCLARVVACMTDYSSLCTRYDRLPEKAGGP